MSIVLLPVGGFRRPGQRSQVLGIPTKSRKVHPTRNRGVLKKQHLAGSRWLTPVILDTQEAEIRRIMV
jgi:hypothetical protein